MSLELKILFTAMSVYFLTALLTGVWKYQHMLNSPNHQAPTYVNIAHAAALHYSFACPVLYLLLSVSHLPSNVHVGALSIMLLFFTSSIATYIGLGFSNRTDNQFKQRTLTTTAGMWALIAGEIGGFLVIGYGALTALWE